MRYSIEGVPGELTTLPGCSQVVVSHAVYVPKDRRGQGVGYTSNIKRQRLAFDELGYDAMICTVISTNLPQKKVLEKAGWSCLTRFTSSNTGHDVELWFIKKGEWE